MHPSASTNEIFLACFTLTSRSFFVQASLTSLSHACVQVTQSLVQGNLEYLSMCNKHRLACSRVCRRHHRGRPTTNFTTRTQKPHRPSDHFTTQTSNLHLPHGLPAADVCPGIIYRSLSSGSMKARDDSLNPEPPPDIRGGDTSLHPPRCYS